MSDENGIIPTGWHLINSLMSLLAAALATVVGWTGRRLVKDLDNKASTEAVTAMQQDIAALRIERKEDTAALRTEFSALRSDASSMHLSNTKLLTDILLKIGKL